MVELPVTVAFSRCYSLLLLIAGGGTPAAQPDLWSNDLLAGKHLRLESVLTSNKTLDGKI